MITYLGGYVQASKQSTVTKRGPCGGQALLKRWRPTLGESLRKPLKNISLKTIIANTTPQISPRVHPTQQYQVLSFARRPNHNGRHIYEDRPRTSQNSPGELGLVVLHRRPLHGAAQTTSQNPSTQSHVWPNDSNPCLQQNLPTSTSRTDASSTNI